MKRLGIFLFYDENGIVDRYIFFLLDSFKDFFDEFVLVINGQVSSAYKEKLESYFDRVLARENIGYDAMAYKEVLLDYLGRKHVCGFDELVIFNDTFFGPVVPWKQIWEKMQDTNSDIWGLTSHESTGEGLSNNWHLQSYFLVIKKSPLNSEAFWTFWGGLDNCFDYNELVLTFERSFSQTMRDAGYCLEAFCKCPDYCVEEPKYNYNYTVRNPYEMLALHGLPILKKKALVCSDGFPVNLSCIEAVRYIKEHTSYDVSMIWENLLRRFSYSELIRGLGLTYVIDTYNNININLSLGGCCIVFLYDDPLRLELYKRYLFEREITISSYFIRYEELSPNRLKELDKYEYICLIRDYDIDYPYNALNAQLECLRIVDNLLHSNAYVKGVIDLFHKAGMNVGAISPSIADDNDYLRHIDDAIEAKEIQNYLCVHHSDIPLDHSQPAIKCHSSAWLTKEAFLYLLSERIWAGDDRLAVRIHEMAMPLLLQSKGYYTLYVGCDEYISKQLVTLSEKRSKTSYDNIRLTMENLKTYLTKNNSRVYIYGAGKIGKVCLNYAETMDIPISAIIVSDTEDITRFSKEIAGNRIIHISDYCEEDGDVVVIGAGKKNGEEINNSLKEKNKCLIYKVY